MTQRKSEEFLYYFGIDVYPKQDLARTGEALRSQLLQSSSESILREREKHRWTRILFEGGDVDRAGSYFPIKLFTTPGWFQDIFDEHHCASDFDDLRVIEAALVILHQRREEKIDAARDAISRELKNNPNDNSPWYYRDEHISGLESNIEGLKNLDRESLLERRAVFKTIGLLLDHEPQPSELKTLMSETRDYFWKNDESRKIIQLIDYKGPELETDLDQLIGFRLITQKIVEWNESLGSQVTTNLETE